MKEQFMSKKNLIKIVLVLLLLVLCGIIFLFSNQNGEKSTGLSRAVTEKITQNIKSIQELEPQEKEIQLLEIEAVIRKIAHFSIYTIMGILLMSFMQLYEMKERKKIFTSIGIGMVYAIFDEIHQLFILERTARVFDVIIDTSGVIMGIAIIVIGSKIAKKIKK